MTEQEKINRANEARRILESPVFKDATKQFLDKIRSLRLQISPRDLEGAHRLILMEQTVEKTARVFEDFLFDGEQAAKRLEEAEDQSFAGKLQRKFRQVI